MRANSCLADLQQAAASREDLKIEPFVLRGTPVWIAGLESLIQRAKTRYELLGSLPEISCSFEELAARLFGEFVHSSELLGKLLQGKLAVLSGDGTRAFVLESEPSDLRRAISTPKEETIVGAPSAAFVEDLNTNVGLLRQTFVSADLQVEYVSLRGSADKRIALVYLRSEAPPQLVTEIRGRLSAPSRQPVRSDQALISQLTGTRWQLISPLYNTELPEQVSEELLRGRVAILMDGQCTAAITPSSIRNFFAMFSDKHFPYPLMLAIRAVRIIGLLVALLLPGLYVALIAVNPETLKIELALSLAMSRLDVPYPAFIEIIIMLFIIEMVVEASLRLPKSIGPTITMVGGIILGQAVVQAQLVSNLVIIVLAATTIANFTLVGFNNALTIRFLKYSIVCLSAMYGVMGLFAGLIGFILYMSSIRWYGIPFMRLR